MTASPLVQVQYSSNVGVWHETAGGVDVSPGDTVSIRIKTATGINNWFLEVFGVDEVTATAPTLTGVSLPTHEVATVGTVVTFVMPSGAGIGRAVLIRSLIRFGGYSAVSKFGIFVKTSALLRVMAVNETFENDPIFGTSVIVNQTIRNIGGGDVPLSRTLTAGAGLTGGGDLTADRTFDVGANGDGSITVNANDIQVGIISDTQHGTRGGGTTHAVATTSVAGFQSGADKARFDTVPINLQALTGNLNGAGNAIVNFDNGHSSVDVDLNATGHSTVLLTSIFASMTDRGLMTASHTYLATIGFRVDIYETSTPTIAGSIDCVIDAVIVTDGSNAPTVTFNGSPNPDFSRLQGAAAVLYVAGLAVTCASAGAGAGFTISATQPTGIACHAGTEYWVNKLKVLV